MHVRRGMSVHNSRGDIQTACALGRKPLFPQIQGLELVCLPDSVLQAASKPSLASLEPIETMGIPLRRIFTHIRQASHSEDANHVRLLLNAANVEIMHHLVDTAHASPIAKPSRTLLHAANAFTFVAGRGSSKSFLSTILVDRLQGEPRDMSTTLTHWRGHEGALLWCLVVGAASVEARSELRLWFVSRLEVVVEMMGLQSRLELEEHLKALLWHDGVLGGFVDEWWEEARLTYGAETPASGDDTQHPSSQEGSTGELQGLSGTVSSPLPRVFWGFDVSTEAAPQGDEIRA
jgi:hypothetical protein